MLFPDEIWVNIITNLDYRSIIELTCANAYFENLLQDNYIWYMLICKNYVTVKYDSLKNYRKTYLKLRKIVYSKVDGKHIDSIKYYTSQRYKDLDIWKFLCEIYRIPRPIRSLSSVATTFEDIGIFFNAKLKATSSLLSVATTAEEIDVFFNVVSDTFRQKFSIVYDNDPNYTTLLLSESYIFGPYGNYIIVPSRVPTDIPDGSIQNVCNDLCYNIIDRKHIIRNMAKDPKYINAIMKYIKDPNNYCCDSTWDKLHKRNVIFYTKTAASLSCVLNYVDDKNAFCQSKDFHLNTPLFNSKNAKHAKILLETVIEPVKYCLYQNRSGYTAIFSQHHVDVVKLILDIVPDKNAYCNIRGRNGKTALFTNNASCCKLILESVTDPEEYCNIVDDFGNTAFHTYTKLDKLQIMFQFIEDKQTICYTQNRDGKTFLHYMFTSTSKKMGPIMKQKMKNVLSATLEHIDDVDNFLNLPDNHGQTIKSYISVLD